MHPIDEQLLVAEAAGGCEAARGELFARYRVQLKREVSARLHPRIRARFDSSDVVQEVLTDATSAFEEYLNLQRHQGLTSPGADAWPFYRWIRKIAERRVIDLHRQHLLAKKRSVRRETPMLSGSGDSGSGQRNLQALLSTSQSSPSQQLIQSEELKALGVGLQQLSTQDREVITLRYMEKLALPQVAQRLNISLAAAKSRHLRAVMRLTQLVKHLLREHS